MPDYSGHVCSQVYFFIQASDIAGGYYIQTACVLLMRLQLTYAGFLVRVVDVGMDCYIPVVVHA